MAWGKRAEPETTPTHEEEEVVVVKPVAPAAPRREAAADGSNHRVGKSVRVKGELSGGEDVRVDGGFEGIIRLDDHRLLVGRTARVHAEVHARDVVIEGQLVGSVVASDRVEITATGSVVGDIRAVRLVVVEGARFKGSVDMDASAKSASPKESSARDASAKESTVRESPKKDVVARPAAAVEPMKAPAPATSAAHEALDDPSLEGPFPSVYEDKF